MPTSAALQIDVINEVCNEHEKTLLRRVAQKKSPHALAQLYRGRYEGENGVEEAVDAIKRKIEERMRERLNGSAARAPRAPAPKPRPGDEDDDGDGGMPVRRVGRNDSPAQPKRGSTTRPPTTAPARASSTPTKPAPAPPETETEKRDARVTALLKEQPRSGASIAERLGVSRSLVRKSLERLQARRIAEPSGEATYDYKRKSGGGPPATAWRLVGDTRKVAAPAKTHHPMSAEQREATVLREKRVLELLTECPRSQRALADAIEEPLHNVRTALEALLAAKLIRDTGCTAHDWVGAVPGRGRPSKVWTPAGAINRLAPLVDMPSAKNPAVMISPNGVGVRAPSLAVVLQAVDRESLAVAVESAKRQALALEALLAAVDACAAVAT